MSMSSDSKSHSSLLGLMLPFSLYNPVLQLKAVADGHHHQNHRLFSHQILANASASNVALHSALHLPASLHHASLAALRHPHLSPPTNSTSSVHSSSSPSVSPALASPPPALNFNPFGHPPSQSHSPKSHHHHHHHQGRLKFSIDNILSPTFGRDGLPLVKDSLGPSGDGDASRSPSSSPTSSISSSKVRLLKSLSQLSTKCTSNATISTPSTSSTTSTNCKATTVSSSGGGPGPHALTKSKYSSDSESSNSSAASTGLSLKKSPKKEPSGTSSSKSTSGSVASSSATVNGKQAPSSSSSSSTSSSSSEYYATDESLQNPNKNPSLTFPLDGKDPIVWPAWVYCTRYSDRPSSGPRSRRVKKKEKKADEKRPRTAFTAEQLQRLKQEFQENRYLTEKRRQDLARDLKLNESQIKIWFQNKRAKIKKTTGQRNPLALHLMAQGLYNHSTASVSGDDDEDEMIDVDRPNSVASTNGNISGGGHQQSSNQISSTSLSSPEPSMADHSMSSDQ